MSSEGSGEITVENNINGGGGGGGEREMIISTSCDDESPRHSHFPEGLRVLLVDDDRVCLCILSQMLKKCRYRVTATSNSAEALMLLKNNEDEFDIVFTNVHMNEIDGFKMLEAGLELDLPVVMMSSNDKTEIIMKGIRHGARDYLIKPLRMAEIKNIWQHVYRKNILPCMIMGSNNRSKIESHERVGEDYGDHIEEELEMNDNALTIKSSGTTDCKSTKRSGGGGGGKNKRKKPDGSGSGSGSEDGVMAMANGGGGGGKRERIRWSRPLHDKFMDAVQKAGGAKKAVPKQILEAMGIDGISREQVASHLQKFRKIITKKQDLETRNKLVMANNNNNNNNHHLPVPPPPPPQVPLVNNNNYRQFRGHMVGPTTGYHTHTNNISNNFVNCPQPQRQLMNNWMVHGGGGYPQSLQAMRPMNNNINPMMMMQPHAQPQLPRVMHHRMDLAPLPPLVGSNINNFQHPQNVQIRDHHLMRPNNNLGGQDCLFNESKNIIEAEDDGVMLDNPQASIVDPSFDNFPVLLDEDFSCFLDDLSRS